MDALHSLNADLSHGLIAELTVFADDQSRLTECAFKWLTIGARKFAGRDILTEVGEYRISEEGAARFPRMRPRGGSTRWGAVAAAPQESFETRYNPYTSGALPWLRRVVEERSESVSVTSGLFTEEGEIGNPDVSLSVVFDEELPEYVKLIVHLDERELIEPDVASAVQAGILRSVRWACDHYNVVFGHVSYRHACGETELERFLKGHDGDPVVNTPRWRSRLRGYSWLMVVPASIVDALGGGDVLRASEVFHSIHELPNGAVLLQATSAFREYRGTAVVNVHQVLRDVLITGEFRKPTPMPGVPPTHMVVLPDPAPDAPAVPLEQRGDAQEQKRRA